MSEVYDAGVLADVQQAQRIVAAFLTAESFSGLLHSVSSFPSGQICRIGSACLIARAQQTCVLFYFLSTLQAHAFLLKPHKAIYQQRVIPSTTRLSDSDTSCFMNASELMKFC